MHSGSPAETRVMPAPSSTNPEERELVIDSGAFVHMPSTKDLSSGELELRRSRKSHYGGNGQWRSAEEAQVYVHDLHL